jgi:YVTN family beta-propeller protein
MLPYRVVSGSGPFPPLTIPVAGHGRSEENTDETMKKMYLALLIVFVAFGCASQTNDTSQQDETTQANDAFTFRQVQSIQLPGVEGRLDHMAVDLQGGRLFVAALGNDTVEVIDLKASKRTDEIKGLKEPQGVVYVPEDDKLLVSNGEGASLDIYDGQSLKLIDKVDLGEDPDNVRYDPAAKLAYVGYGTGNGSALGVVDVDKDAKISDIELSGHPESFQLESSSKRIFANVPASDQITLADRESDSVVATWPIEDAAENFPMALDEADQRLFVGTRSPAKLLVLDTETDDTVASLDSSGDADDIFYDARTKRIYVSGGEGAISLFEQAGPDDYRPAGKVDTADGARTSLFVNESGTLYVAVPHRGSQQAEVRVFQIE